MRITFLLSFLLCFQTSIFSQSENKSKAVVIDSLLTSYKHKNLFNGVALVADAGEIILHKSFGLADIETQTPLTIHDRFYIGSLTKQFTSVLILQLQEENLIDIHQPLSSYLKEFSDSIWRDITVHQLLTHTSGIGSYTSHHQFDKSTHYSEEEMYALIKTPLLFQPGSDWSYSNSGYFLLGKIAEHVTHQTYGDLLKTKIFEPLKMNNTSFSYEWLEHQVAKGYQMTINGMQSMPSYSQISLFSTGGIYSTVNDLFTWSQALLGEQLLNIQSKTILFQPLKNDYACGVYVKKGIAENGTEFERHFHGGMIQGYHSFMLHRIPQNQVIILLDNFYNQEIQTIKNRIWSALIDAEIKPIKPLLSNLLYVAIIGDSLITTMNGLEENNAQFEENYTFEEFDINKVAYRLMEEERYSEANVIFKYNMKHYPESWNVYDSMGELEFLKGNYKEAELLYKKSLTLNPANNSAQEKLKKINILLNE